MVSQTIETPEVDLATPETETESEVPAEPAGDGAAAPDEVEAATDDGEEPAGEPEQIQPVEEERKYTEAELREQRRIAQQEALEYDRRQRQAENARRAAEARREEQERAELRDVVEVAIARGDDAEAINNLLSRYTDKRAGQHVERAISAMDTAVHYLTQPLLGGEPVTLDESSTQIAFRLQDRLHAIYEKGLEDGKAVLAGDTIPKAELPKYVKAEIERQNKAKNQDKKPLGRVDGDSAIPRDDSDEARVNRIISNTADDRDKEWWDGRFGRK